MIKSIWVKNASGDYLDLSMRGSLQSKGLLIFNLEGLGAPKTSVLGGSGPFFDGIRVTSVRTDTRQLVLTLTIPEQGDKEEAAKALIYKFFPVKQPIIFGVVTDERNVYIQAYVEENEITQFSKVESAVISLLCPKPFFKDLIQDEYTLGINVGLPRFEFPFSNESTISPLLEFGEHLLTPAIDIDYDGGAATGCTINLYFTGVTTGITITNTNGSQSMTISPTTQVQNGDQITINTRVGEKKITHTSGLIENNIINDVGLFDDWLEIRPGLNTVRMSALTGLEFVACDILFNPLRQGV